MFTLDPASVYSQARAPGRPGRDQPATSPGQDRFPERIGRGGRFDTGPISELDLQTALKFLEEHSPHRAMVMKRLLAENRFGIRRQIVTRWRELKALETEDPTLYTLKLDQLKVEDMMFAEAAAIRQNRGSTQEHNAVLRKMTREFVHLRNQERRHLVKKLQDAIAADEANPDKAIEERMQRELNGNRGESLQGSDGKPSPTESDAAPPPPEP